MERIKKIFQSFSKTEVRYLKNYLTAFHSRGKNKALEMIEILEKEPDLGNKEMSTRLYGDASSKAFIMLKSRVLEKMLETISLSINFHNNPAFKDDRAAFEAINIQKNLIYAFLLRRRGLDDQAREILEKCAKVSEELSLPEYRLLALINLRNFSSSRQDVVWSYKQEIESSLEQFKTDIIGSGIFDEFRILSDSTSRDNAKESFLAEKILELEERLEKAYSARSHYYYLTMKVFHHEFCKEFAQARVLLEEMIDLLQSHEGLGSKNRLGIPYHQLASTEIRIGNYAAAIKAADHALSFFHRKKYNYYSTSIYKAFAAIYNGQPDLAVETLNGLERFKSQKRFNFLNGIVTFLQACIKYLHGETKQAQAILFNANELFNDKAGWNTGIRIFEIIILLDMEMEDLAAAKIESLRKHVAKYDVSPRSKQIYKYLHLLERNAFDFDSKSPEMEALYLKLRHEEPWSSLNHEVVRFDIWLDAKAQRTDYYPLLLDSLKAHQEDANAAS